MGVINFRFFTDNVLFFKIMLYYIINILFDVSINYNIYNIIHFSREVKRNCIKVNYLKISFLLRDFSTSLEMTKKIAVSY